jgi:hypothetical protein
VSIRFDHNRDFPSGTHKIAEREHKCSSGALPVLLLPFQLVHLTAVATALEANEK